VYDYYPYANLQIIFHISVYAGRKCDGRHVRCGNNGGESVLMFDFIFTTTLS